MMMMAGGTLQQHPGVFVHHHMDSEPVDSRKRPLEEAEEEQQEAQGESTGGPKRSNTGGRSQTQHGYQEPLCEHLIRLLITRVMTVNSKHRGGSCSWLQGWGYNNTCLGLLCCPGLDLSLDLS